MSRFEPAVIAALVAAMASLLVAITTAIASRRNTTDLERLKRALDLENEELRGVLQYLKTAATAIQSFRDTLLMIARAPVGTLSRDAAYENVRICVDRYVALYGDFVGALPPSVARLTHDAKDLMLTTLDRTRSMELSPEFSVYLDQVRAEMQLVEAKVVAARIEALLSYKHIAEKGA